MKISPQDVALFFKMHPALLQYVNQRLNIFPNIKSVEKLRMSGVENVNRVRTKLWERTEYITEFISANPNHFGKSELAIIASWKNAIQGKFYMLKHLKKYTVFLTESEPANIYGVCSLNTPLNDMFPRLPIYADAVLIPFKDHIIYDGILHPYLITFGPGFRFDLNESYREAKDRFGVITTLGK